MLGSRRNDDCRAVGQIVLLAVQYRLALSRFNLTTKVYEQGKPSE